MTYVRFALDKTIIPTIKPRLHMAHFKRTLSLTLYHPGSSNWLLAMCVCLSVRVFLCSHDNDTKTFQMLRASLSESLVEPAQERR